MARYSPWRDLETRHPSITVGRAGIKPTRGAWVQEVNVIVLDHDLDRVTCNATLAHEVAHIDLGHHDHQAPGRWFADRWEREADNLAAVRLLDDVDEIADAVALYPHDIEKASHHLDVSADVLWRRLTRLTNAERLLVVERLDRIERSC